MLLIDRVPEPKLGRDAIVEPVQDRQAVAALGRGGQAEQLAGCEMVEHRSYDGAAAWWNSSTMTTSKWSGGEVRRGPRRRGSGSRRRHGRTRRVVRRRPTSRRTTRSRSACRNVARLWSRISSRWATNSSRDRSSCCGAGRSRARPSRSCPCRSRRRAGCGGVPAARDSSISSRSRSWNGYGRSSIGLRMTRGPLSERPARRCSSSNCPAS